MAVSGAGSAKRKNLNEITIPPFLKWAGGKRWFVQKYEQVLPKQYDRYIEPFLGGGSVFFHLKPKKALLGDCNQDLIDTYKGIKKDHIKIVEILSEHHRHHDEDYYYKIRASKPQELIEKAAKFIYLNRTCFNGIYRVNRFGEFNVPKGSKSNVLLDTDDFQSLSQLLHRASLKACDFEKLIDQAGEGDFVFADPPYTVRHNLNGFIKYNEKLFSWGDQIRLAAALTRARKRGAQIICTNANHESVRELYSSTLFGLNVVSRYSSISAKTTSRNQYEELVVTATT